MVNALSGNEKRRHLAMPASRSGWKNDQEAVGEIPKLLVAFGVALGAEEEAAGRASLAAARGVASFSGSSECFTWPSNTAFDWICREE
jgi:hypothetical protein